MANELSAYADEIVTAMQADYGGWTIYRRRDAVQVDERAWSVEVSMGEFEPYHNGTETVVRFTGAATVLFEAKAPTHDSMFQAIDIAASLCAWMTHRHIEGGVVCEEVGLVLEPEVVDGMPPRASGRFIAGVTWRDEVIVTPQIDIEGYTTQNPPMADRPDGPDHGPIDSIDVTLQARDRC